MLRNIVIAAAAALVVASAVTPTFASGFRSARGGGYSYGHPKFLICATCPRPPVSLLAGVLNGSGQISGSGSKARPR
jgi:hypothetical protein